MMAADLPDPGLGKAARDTGGGYLEVRPATIWARPSRGSPTSCTANTCSAYDRRRATARRTRSK